MADLYQIPVQWSGGAVVDNASSSWWTDTAHVTAAQTALDGFNSTLRKYVLPGVTMTVPNSGKVYDDATGIVKGEYHIGASNSRTSNATGTGPACAGALLKLSTGTTVGRRILRGHVFAVPLASNAYEQDGRLNATCQNELSTALATMLTASGDFLFKVWHRPVRGVGGVSAFISGSSVPFKVAVLTSRRD